MERGDCAPVRRSERHVDVCSVAAPSSSVKGSPAAPKAAEAGFGRDPGEPRVRRGRLVPTPHVHAPSSTRSTLTQVRRRAGRAGHTRETHAKTGQAEPQPESEWDDLGDRTFPRSSAPRIADCYAICMTVQLVARIPDKVAGAVDDLVRAGVYASRSEAVRAGLDAVIDQQRRARVGQAIVAGYRTTPQQHDDLAWSDAASAAMMAEEPW